MSEELINRLAVLAPGSVKATMTADISGLPIHRIDFTGSPQTMWYKVLTEAKNHKDGVLKIINTLLKEYSEDTVLLNERSKLSQTPQSEEGNPINKTLIDKTALKKIVGNNNIEKVLDILTNSNGLLDTDAKNEVLGLERKHKSLKKDKRLGIISSENYNMGINQVTNNLLEFIDSINT